MLLYFGKNFLKKIKTVRTGRDLSLQIFFIFLFSLISATTVAKPFRVILDWFVNPDHAPLFVAEQQGYFKEAGLEVKFIPPADPSDPMKLVAAGQAELGVGYGSKFPLQLKQGLPLVQVGTLIKTPLDCLVVLKDSHIKKIADLKGKKIGYSSSSTDSVTLEKMLQYHGLSFKNVMLVNVHYNLTQALLSKKVDAVMGAMRNFEPIEIELTGQSVRLFYPEKNGMPPYPELILVTNKNELHDPRIHAFLSALHKGVIYLKQHPKQSWKTFAKNHPELNNELNKRAWFETVPYF